MEHRLSIPKYYRKARIYPGRSSFSLWCCRTGPIPCRINNTRPTCISLLIAHIGFVGTLDHGMQPILHLRQLKLLEWPDLMDLLRGDPSEPASSPPQAQSQFAWYLWDSRVLS